MVVILSKQDTVVALEGLSSYAAISSASPPVMTVTVRYKESLGGSNRKMLSMVEKVMKIDSSNYDILQRIDLPVGTNVKFTVEGTGKAVMSVGTVWNTKAKPSEPTFLVMPALCVFCSRQSAMIGLLCWRRSQPGPAGC